MSSNYDHYMGQDGVWLENSHTRLFVQKFGGMTPEFSYRAILDGQQQWVNSHWNPHFRSLFSGQLSDLGQQQQTYWGIELMRQAAGTFPCGPTFGPGNDQLLPHGDLANSDWQLTARSSLKWQDASADEHACDYAVWELEGGYEGLAYKKWDLLYQSQSSHYMVLQVTNNNAHPVAINLAWHTTLGAPFLERGCQIVNNCGQFSTPPTGTEFDQTAALASSAQFSDFSSAPCHQGGNKDLSQMPGYNGCAEFVTGTTTHRQYLWSVCVNPYMDLAYLSIVPYNAIENQVNASFMNYWIHSGGRDFAPWADYQGGVDRTYALGMEASVGASCLGLDWSKQNPNYMGKPANIRLETNQTVSFPCINSLFSLVVDGGAGGNGDSVQLAEQIRQRVEQHIADLDLEFMAYQVLNPLCSK